MPPRKSADAEGLGVEDLALPRSMVQRLAKGVLPANTQIQKDAILAMSKSATVFVNYLANTANDRALMANKKTIQPQDVLETLKDLEFEAFLPRCESELQRYNQIQCSKRNDYRKRVREEQAAAKTNDGSQPAGDESTMSAGAGPNGSMVEGRPPASKRARGPDGMPVDGQDDDDEMIGDEDMEDEADEDDDNDEQEDEGEEGEEDDAHTLEMDEDGNGEGAEEGTPRTGFEEDEASDSD